MIISPGFQVIIMIISPPVQVIAAEGEHKASRALRHAAEVIADSPAALQVTRRIMVAIMVVVMVMIMIAWWMLLQALRYHQRPHCCHHMR